MREREEDGKDRGKGDGELKLLEVVVIIRLTCVNCNVLCFIKYKR